MQGRESCGGILRWPLRHHKPGNRLQAARALQAREVVGPGLPRLCFTHRPDLKHAPAPVHLGMLARGRCQQLLEVNLKYCEYCASCFGIYCIGRQHDRDVMVVVFSFIPQPTIM